MQLRVQQLLPIVLILLYSGELHGAERGTVPARDAGTAPARDAGTAPAPAPRPQPAEPATADVKQLALEDILPENERTGYDAAPPPPMHDYLSGEYGPACDAERLLQRQQGARRQDRQAAGVPGAPRGRRQRPYFGACIHAPPPPNQIVFVKFEKGIALDSVYAAHWTTGRLETQSRNTRYGAAAYTLRAQQAEVYQY